MSSDRVSVHFTGRPSARGGRGDEELDIHRGLRPEAAAHPRAHDAQLLGLEPQRRRHGGVRGVRSLVRDPARESAGGLARHGHDAVALHRHAGEALAHHGDLGDHVGALERVDILTELRGEADVRTIFGEQKRRVGRQPRRGGHHDREGVVVGDDGVGGIGRLLMGLGHDRRHDVADETHAVLREHGPVQRRRQQWEALHRGQAEVVGGRVHRDHPGHVPGRLGVDRQDVAVGDIRPHEHHVGRVGEDEVVEVATRPGEQCRVLEPNHRVTENGTSCCHCDPPGVEPPCSIYPRSFLRAVLNGLPWPERLRGGPRERPSGRGRGGRTGRGSAPHCGVPTGPGRP